jgi:maltose alpha-D-glucosyltransferase/alpha-amylase
VAGYSEVCASSAAVRPWVTPEQMKPLLDLFLLERAAYEVGYEAANRVTWIDLPVSGLARLLRRLSAAPAAPAAPAGTVAGGAGQVNTGPGAPA